jgi:hypothetical protein
MELKSLGNIIVDFLNARKWFKSVGVSTTGTRLDEIDRYLQELLNPTGTDANPFSGAPLNPAAFHVLNEAAGFGRIARGLASVSTQLIPRGLLRDCLRGPFALSGEFDPATRDPRNKFVELELAAYCADAGINLIGFDDVKFEFEGTRYLVQCKRPASMKSLYTNIDNAYKQLRDRLEEVERGIVAIAVDKVFALDERFHDAESAEDLSRIGIKIAISFGKLVAKYEGTWLDTRVVGIAAIIRFLGRSKNSGQVAYSYQVCVIKLASEHCGQAADSLRLDRLAAALRSQMPRA